MMELLKGAYEKGLALLNAGHPAWIVGAVALLPLCGVPVIPLLVLAGVRLGPLNGSLLASGALATNVSLGYWLAARWLRLPVERVLAARGHRIPTVPREDEIKFVLLCRLTPGLPLTIQNYVLGGARVNFGRYLLVSLPIQVAWGIAFVVFGNSLVRSSVRGVVLAACLLVALGLFIALLRRWSRTRMWDPDAVKLPPAT